MKFAVNKSEGSPHLLICFLGWASDEKMLDNFDVEGYDIVSVYDYRDADVPAAFLDLAAKYVEISILAWSFGVFVAERVAPLLPKPIYALAINGTPIPSSANYGIHPRALDLTIKNLDVNKFYERMCAEEYSAFSPCERSVEELREELVFLCGWFKETAEKSIKWGGAIIGERDVIFSYKNMLNYWQESSIFDVLEIADIPHYPFGVSGIEKIKKFYCGG